MAYKFATGSVQRGDIYNEDDVQGNTYLDWNEDAVGVVAGGTTVFVVSGSTAKVGIGTDSPDYTLDVAGNAGFDEYLYHNDDDDTFIRFQTDEINIKAGDVNFISITETTQNKIVFNDGAADVDFIVRSPDEALALYLNAGNEVFHINHGETSFKTKIHSTNGEAITVTNSGVILNEDGAAANDFRVESDTNTHMFFIDAGSSEIGIGTSSPDHTLAVVGDISASVNISASYFWGDGSKLQNVTGSGGGGGSPGGSNTQIQFNDSDSFAGESVFVWIKADNMCGVGTGDPLVALDVHHTGASDPTGLTNDEGGGEVVFYGTSSAGLETGALYYLNSDGGWASASAAATGSGHTQLLGVSIGAKPAEDGMLIRGFFDIHTYYSGSFTKGAPAYIHSGSSGYVSDQAPSASDSYVRIIGYGTDTANVVYFNPDSTYVEIA